MKLIFNASQAFPLQYVKLFDECKDTVIELSGSITADQLQELFYLLSKQPNIKKLILGDCKFDANAIMQFQQLMIANKTIEELNICGVDALLQRSEVTLAIPILIIMQQNTHIQKLWLGQDSVVFNDFHLLIGVLEKRQAKLTELSITNACCGSSTLESLKAFLNNNQITVFLNRLKVKCSIEDANECATTLNDALKKTVKIENVTDLCFGPDLLQTHKSNDIFVTKALSGLKNKDSISPFTNKGEIVWALADLKVTRFAQSNPTMVIVKEEPQTLPASPSPIPQELVSSSDEVSTSLPDSKNNEEDPSLLRLVVTACAEDQGVIQPTTKSEPGPESKPIVKAGTKVKARSALTSAIFKSAAKEPIENETPAPAQSAAASPSPSYVRRNSK